MSHGDIREMLWPGPTKLVDPLGKLINDLAVHPLN